MKKAINFRGIAILMPLLLFITMPVMAQKSRSDAKIANIKIKDVVTPTYRESQEGSKGARNRWCKLEVEYDTKGRNEWINELEVRWTVMIEADNLRQYAGLMQTVTYTDVADGKHFACVYIKPKFFERYMRSKRIEPNKISTYVEIWVDGQRVAREEKRSNRAPKEWFTKTDQMKTFANELLPKSKTPFAPLDYDYYEHEKVN